MLNKRENGSFFSKPLFAVKLSGILLSLAVLFVVGLFVCFYRSSFLIAISELLIENHPLKETEVLFILGGDVTSTVDYAAFIYSNVQPRLILVSKNGREEQVVRRLVKLHRMPRDKIQILPSAKVVTSTYEEALVLRDYCQRVPVKSFTIVTVTFHTGRAYWTFRTILPKKVEIRMAGAPEEGFSKSNWWQTEDGLITVNNEFLKWVYYWWNYANE